MHLYKTYDDGYLFRIEEEKGAYITVKIDNSCARVLSVWVPPKERLEGMGTILFTIAERESVLRGIEIMEVDFVDEIWELIDFLLDRGYKVNEKDKILSFPIEDILSSGFVERLRQQKLPGYQTVFLDTISEAQFTELIKVLHKNRFPLYGIDMAFCWKELSLVVFDEMGAIRSFVLCSDTDSGIHIDLVWTDKLSDPRYIRAMFLKFIDKLTKTLDVKKKKKITIMIVDQRIKDVIKKEIEKEVSSEIVGAAISAKKKLSHNDQEYEVRDIIIEEVKNEWHYEADTIPYQLNIGWKAYWSDKRPL